MENLPTWLFPTP